MKGASAQHLKKAEHFLIVAKDMLNLGHYSDSINRSYYGTFHAVKAVLSELDIKRASHHAVWTAFAENVTNPGLIDRHFHRDGWTLFNRRLDADYMTDSEDTREDAVELMGFATELVKACSDFLVKPSTGESKE